LREGAVRQVSINAYERNPVARRKCIEHYGISCFICNFNFSEVFGELGEGFIHVHHLKPLSEIGEEYEVNPIEDMRPVCPNCHAMLHHHNSLLSIEEVKAKLTQSNHAT
jgi:5-methylcytosine-specific restriction enzyme A